MLEQMKRKVYEANLLLQTSGLVKLTWGNASGIDRDSGLVVIKPSGVEYDRMTADDMVVVDLSGRQVEGRLRPSSDTPTHLELYRSFAEIGGVVHTHSMNATAFAQACMPVPCYGTTHADCFYGDVPCTRMLTPQEVAEAYELNTGKVIAETFGGIDYSAVPAVVVAGHGAFSWGKDAADAVNHSIVLEEVAAMAILTRQLSPRAERLPQYVLDKHYYRKHGANAYYGQK